MSEVPVYEINVHQGETWTMTIVVRDENLVPKDLTGYTARLEVRDRPGGNLLLGMASGSGITVDGPIGEIALELTAAQTAALAFRSAVHDLLIISPAPSTTTYLIKGAFKVAERVTVQV